MSICYQAAGPFSCKKAATFTGQFSVIPGDFSGGGDSGSLIVTMDRDPVGLLFAGSSTRTIASPIGPILTRFGVSIDPTVPEGGANTPPTAGFTYSCTDLTCDFTDTSADNGGTIVAWDRDFGHGTGSTDQNPSHTYLSGSTFDVTLTVTDNDGETDSFFQDVTVSTSGGGGIILTATGYKVRGFQKADLGWSNATSPVVVYRNGIMITASDAGFYADEINQRGGGSYTYEVCEAETDTCSNEATVTF